MWRPIVVGSRHLEAVGVTEQRRPKSIVMSFGSVQAVRLHQLCSPRYSWGWLSRLHDERTRRLVVPTLAGFVPCKGQVYDQLKQGNEAGHAGNDRSED